MKILMTEQMQAVSGSLFLFTILFANNTENNGEMNTNQSCSANVIVQGNNYTINNHYTYQSENTHV